jgi:thioredoxin-related protein
MDKDTYNNDKVGAMINDNFKAVKINPEKPGTFKFNGKEYSSRDLVATLSNNGVRGYPATLFLVPHANNKAELSVGYKPADAFLTELNTLRTKYGSGPATQTKN